MKIGGKKISGPKTATVVFPRGDSEDDWLVFKVQAVLDMENFENLCPLPQPPTIVIAKTGEKKPDLDDKKYLAKVREHNTLRFTYTILKSLEATEGLEWDTVDMHKPETWNNYENDLKAAGLSTSERNYLLMSVIDANSISEDKLKEARDHFLRSQAKRAAEESLSQKDEPTNTESGEPASESESGRQE